MSLFTIFFQHTPVCVFNKYFDKLFKKCAGKDDTLYLQNYIMVYHQKAVFIRVLTGFIKWGKK
jgi:hypothetical protein